MTGFDIGFTPSNNSPEVKMAQLDMLDKLTPA
jgi:hypothetical protein